MGCCVAVSATAKPAYGGQARVKKRTSNSEEGMANFEDEILPLRLHSGLKAGCAQDDRGCGFLLPQE